METKQVIVVRKDLNMRKGKLAAQVAHASMAFITRNLDVVGKTRLFDGEFAVHTLLTQEQLDWLSSSFTKICVYVNSEEELEAVASKAEAAGLTTHRIIDNGLTEFNGVKTFTCVGIGPAECSKINEVTGHLPLL
jgi:PTH2 family peptidyl-tRNA hydrolase